MAAWAYIVVVLIAVLGLGAYLHLRSRAVRRIWSTISGDPAARQEDARAAREPSGLASVAVGGSASLEQFGDLMRLDPDVMAAFERAMGDGAIKSAPQVAAWAERYLADPTSSGYQIQLNRLTGFAGEQRVERLLQKQGHDALLHGQPNVPGTDITVDGLTHQIKTSSNEAVPLEHLDRYPMEPVIVPTELAELADASTMVTAVPGFDLATLTTDIGGTLGGAADYVNPLEGMAAVPVLSIGLAGFRAYRGYQTSNTSLGRALEEFGIDATLLTIGIMGGKILGGVASVAGLAHGLPTEPTVMMVGGSAAGGYTAHRAGKSLKNLRQWNAARDFSDASETLGKALVKDGLPLGERAPMASARRAVKQAESAYGRRALREAIWPSMRGQMVRYLVASNKRNLVTVTKAVDAVEAIARSHLENGDWRPLGDIALANPWLAEQGGAALRGSLLNGLDARNRIAREMYLKRPRTKTTQQDDDITGN